MRPDLERIGAQIVTCAVELHQTLGPGLLESVYEVTLASRLASRGLAVQRQVRVPMVLDGLRFEEAFRADLIVEQAVVVELKSVEAIAPVHIKQALTYLRILDFKLGYLLNFGAPTMKAGIRRLVNGLPEA